MFVRVRPAFKFLTLATGLYIIIHTAKQCYTIIFIRSTMLGIIRLSSNVIIEQYKNIKCIHTREKETYNELFHFM